jgi:hypothetical protein
MASWFVRRYRVMTALDLCNSCYQRQWKGKQLLKLAG